jgi:predicted DCC family thiol-disulfide oxidoreductase YuxK
VPRGADHLQQPIILFDGICNLCEWWVQFIIKRDIPALFRFAPLQSQTAQRLMAQYGLCPASVRTMVLIDGGSAFTKSDAALRIASYLPGMWSLLGVLYIIPRFLRNWAYDLVAKNRYRWFGKHDACMVPTADILDRFLE